MTTSLGTDTVPAAVLALHTGSETLGWNPHAHLIVADGGFTKEDTFVRLALWDLIGFTEIFLSVANTPVSLCRMVHLKNFPSSAGLRS